jgi:exopolysaccharide biosynthesis protein
MKRQAYITAMAVMAILPLRLAAGGASSGLRIIRHFEAVPAYSISNANVIEVDPALFRIATLSARKAAAKNKVNMLDLRKLLPGAALMINAGFFNPSDGALIGEFVEDGARPDGIIYANGGHIDRIFTAARDGAVDIISGTENLTDKELAGIRSAVAGKSAWPGHTDATNRTAICLTDAGKVLIAAVYPVRTLQKLFAYMQSEGCLPEKTVDLDGGGSTQMSYNYGETAWTLGWERKGASVPECHLTHDNADRRCYRPVATFITVEPLGTK